VLLPPRDPTHATGSHPEALRLPWHEAIPIKQTPRTAVLRLETPGTEVPFDSLIAKCILLDARHDRLKAVVRMSRLAREARAARRISAIVRTPETLALARGRPRAGDRSTSPVEALIRPLVPGRTLLHACASRRVDDLAEPVGAKIGSLARRRFLNRDHKPSNLIVSPDRSTIALVDTGGVRRTLRPGVAVERMITSLIIETTHTCGPPASAWLEGVGAAALATLHRATPSPGAVDRLLKRVDRRVATRLIRNPGVPRDDPLAADDLARALEGGDGST